MTAPLFDPALLALRRARAARMDGGAFLFERAFDECLERIALVRRPFRSALLFGRANLGWSDRLRSIGITELFVLDPDSPESPPVTADLCLSIGALDTAEPLPSVLMALRHLLAPDGLLIGALAGGNSLPALRRAMLAADSADGRAAAAHVHPRIDPPSFAALLGEAGFVMPVVDVDRVALRYGDLDGLVRDLRAMAATNRLLERPRRPVLRAGLAAARDCFAPLADRGRTTETIEILHFAAWTPEAAARN